MALLMHGLIVANIGSILLSLILLGICWYGVMFVQTWHLYENVKVTWHFLLWRVGLTLDCTTKSPEFFFFCMKAVKRLKGVFEQVVDGFCDPAHYFSFLQHSCDDAELLAIESSIALCLVIAAMVLILASIIFLEAHRWNYNSLKPYSGRFYTAVTLLCLAWILSIATIILYIVSTNRMKSIFSFRSDVIFYQSSLISSYYCWGFYSLVAVTAFLALHIVALLNSSQCNHTEKCIDQCEFTPSTYNPRQKSNYHSHDEIYSDSSSNHAARGKAYWGFFPISALSNMSNYNPYRYNPRNAIMPVSPQERVSILRNDHTQPNQQFKGPYYHQ